MTHEKDPILIDDDFTMKNDLSSYNAEEDLLIQKGPKRYT